jgi:tetratricopeptide repeat protein
MIAAPLDRSPAAKTTSDRLQLAAGWAVSLLLLATLIVAAAALGTSILGVPTYFGSGVDSSLGGRVARDFLADQAAEATALSTGDQGPLGGNFTDSALADVIQQMSNQSGSGTSQTVTLQPATLTVVRASDPNNAALTIEVQEDGTETVVTNTGATSAPSEQSISFHGDYWLRVPSGSHYAIADMNFQTLPSSPLPAISVVAAALVAVAIAALLFVRQRRFTMAVQPTPQQIPELAGLVLTPAQREASIEPPRQAAAMVVSTFDALHVREDGRDWAQELMSRPVTGFVWLRLLVAAIRDPRAQPSREEIAKQACPPGLSRDVQLKRLRNVIGRGFREMPAQLSRRIRVEPEALSFQLDDCSVDAIELLAVSAECSGQSQLMRPQVEKVRRVLATCKGDFLREFEIVENIATERHPNCTALMAELREQLVGKRADLALLLADAHLRDGQPLQAIAILEPALQGRSERGDIRARLAAAYTAAGRNAEADAVVRPA